MKRGKSNHEIQQELEDMYNDLDILRWDIEEKLDEEQKQNQESQKTLPSSQKRFLIRNGFAFSQYI